MTDEDQSACAGCRKWVDEDHFCYGCKHYICDECDDGITSRAAQTAGPHDFAAHLEKMSDPYEEGEW